MGELRERRCREDSSWRLWRNDGAKIRIGAQKSEAEVVSGGRVRSVSSDGHGAHGAYGGGGPGGRLTAKLLGGGGGLGGPGGAGGAVVLKKDSRTRSSLGGAFG